jgi:hypothetical protein
LNSKKQCQKDRLFKDLEKCVCDNRRQYTYPFFFEIKQQKVMLITLIPSFQAVYRQLTSIRFFRQIFLALCGPNPKIRSGSLVESFLDSIYWTHFHKCYLPRERDQAIPEPDSIPDYCFKKYIEREINVIKPKLIIVLGKPLVYRLFQEDLVQSSGVMSSR